MTRKAIIVAFLLTTALAAWAQDKGVGHILNPAKNKRTTSPIKMVEGKIAEIGAGKVIIENDYGAKKELRLNGKTKFQLSEKKKARLTEVRPGTFVKITFNETDLTAKKVEETTRKFRD
ncbi:MAG TPA: hypothetical protein VFZ34_32420 [Blastocatellia bacterium]|nr:hypothetical protein [Blastocatellia bacterium]